MTKALVPVVGAALIIGQCLVLIGCLVVFIIIYRLLFHPLARIPGPKVAAISNVWHAHHARNGKMLRLGKTLHRLYGPVVRVGPNEVWIDTKEAFAQIYSALHGYEKSDFYLATSLHRPKLDSSFTMQFPDSLDLLSERDMDRYRLQRRLIGPLYSVHHIQRYEHAVDGVMEKVIVELSMLQNVDLDLKMWMHIIAVECLSAIVLSYSPGYLKTHSDWGSSHHAYKNWRRKSVFGLFIPAVLAESYCKSAGRLFARLWCVTFVTPAPFKPFFTPVYHKIKKRLSAALTPEFEKSVSKPKPGRGRAQTHLQSQGADEKPDLLADLIRLHLDKPTFSLSYLKRMAMTNFGAGHETTTSALIAAVTCIASHGRVYRRVMAELDDSQQQPDPIPCAAELSAQTPYLLCAIKEAQRLYPVLGMSPSRTVPASGLEINGHFLPPGTRAGCNPISLHRNTDIFGFDAEIYNPDRWIDVDGTDSCISVGVVDTDMSSTTNDRVTGSVQTKAHPHTRPQPRPQAQTRAARIRDMERYNLIWGGGARICPGRNLAQMMLVKIIAVLLREFEIEVQRPGQAWRNDRAGADVGRAVGTDADAGADAPAEQVAVDGLGHSDAIVDEHEDDETEFYFMAMLTGVKVRFVRRARTDTSEKSVAR